MITVTTVLTLHLAKAIGVWCLAAGLSGLLAPRRWMEVVDGLRREKAVALLAGVAAYAIGAALILTHSIWLDPLAVVVTLVGWAAAIKGLILIVSPEPLLRLAVDLVKPGATRAFSLILVLLGAILLIAGLIGRAGPLL